MTRKGMLNDIEIISNFLREVEMVENYSKNGGYNKLIEAIKSTGNLKALLSFQSIMISSMKRELEGLYKDINGEEIQIREEN